MLKFDCTRCAHYIVCAFSPIENKLDDEVFDIECKYYDSSEMDYMDELAHEYDMMQDFKHDMEEKYLERSCGCYD